MIVQSILGDKEHTKIFSIQKSQTLAEAAADLATHRIGALIVSQDGKTVDGIISERDIVRELGKRGAACMSDKVEDVMTSTVTCATLNNSTQDVLETMTQGRFRHMPVLTDGVLVGIVTIGDVVKARLKEMAHENAAMLDMIQGG